MKTPPRILVVDDNPMNVDILRARLVAHGYDVVTALDGKEALARVEDTEPDLILLDRMMPVMDGIEVCQHLRADGRRPYVPIIMVTARGETADTVEALEAGCDEYLTKPVDHAALVARVNSMLRIKRLQDTVQAQAGELERWARTLETRVVDQCAELERLGRLKRFFSPKLAELIVAGGADDPLRSHRRELTVVFVDLRGFTTFAETTEPEETMRILREYHAALGALVVAHEGTVERFTGDGIMIFFNDPLEVPDPAARAVRMALAMRERVGHLSVSWRKQGYDLNLGIGIALGYATIGAIGFDQRWDYGAIGNVTNLASRLCAEAAGGQVLVSRRVCAAVESLVDVAPVGELQLKGFARPVPAFNVLGLRRAS